MTNLRGCCERTWSTDRAKCCRDLEIKVLDAMIATKASVMVFFSVIAATAPSRADSSISPTAHDFSFDLANGNHINLADYAGAVVLVVNTASRCSFTEQYGPLQQLYEKYRDRGLVVIAVPSNDFGGQEPGRNEEIVAFAQREFSVGFPITAKTGVKGSNAAPFYRWAADQVGILGQPRWNFHKYLIGPGGELITWFASFTKPNSARLADAIESALPPASKGSKR